ncbi:MAG: helix-turn-helix domain-containing protein [Nevskia sp.]|jgi:transcriptional regulator with XRE-family HTH domain|nr:helix-turn-helix domain-containing protein [Nevskia sp.]MCK9385064.1 helix-turn-helix domain-containing protein [Nevskia sp.]
MNTFYQRLKLERERLRLSQTEFAEIGGVKKGAQINYEKGERSPDADYLERVGAYGVDLSYLLTGTRSVVRPGMSAAEIDQFNDIVDLFWNLSDEGRQTAKSLLGAIVHQEFEKNGGTRGVKK